MCLHADRVYALKFVTLVYTFQSRYSIASRSKRIRAGLSHVSQFARLRIEFDSGLFSAAAQVFTDNSNTCDITGCMQKKYAKSRFADDVQIVYPSL